MQAIEPEDHLSQQEINRFQIERLILFTDAVFAIAITLLIIEIKVPHFEERPDEAALGHALAHQLPEWIGFVVGFAVIGIYWAAHHRMFGHVRKYDARLIFLNFVFLMSIVIMPFTSALYSSYFGYDLSFRVYCFNVAITGLLQGALWLHITHPGRSLSQGINLAQRRYTLLRAGIVPLVFLIAALLTYVNPWLARFSFFLIFVLQMALIAYYRKRGVVLR